MENIKQALERARTGRQDTGGGDPVSPFPSRVSSGPAAGPVNMPPRVLALSLPHLEANRIVAHDETDVRSRSFDLLRTQVLQSMAKKNWRFLGITSPTPGCGKTVTAVNLAFSIARQPERSALLIDLDLQRPQVATCLGIKSSDGLVGVLEGKTSLPNEVIQTRAGPCGPLVLPVARASSSAWIASRAMNTMLQDVRQEYEAPIVIIDLPPMLLGDDVIALLPQLDCILLVAAVGKTKLSEIEECKKHLMSTEIIRFVLNKVPGIEAAYYDYYSSPKRRPAK